MEVKLSIIGLGPQEKWFGYKTDSFWTLSEESYKLHPLKDVLRLASNFAFMLNGKSAADPTYGESFAGFTHLLLVGINSETNNTEIIINIKKQNRRWVYDQRCESNECRMNCYSSSTTPYEGAYFYTCSKCGAITVQRVRQNAEGKIRDPGPPEICPNCQRRTKCQI